MNELLELVRGPHDVGNVPGGMMGGAFGVVQHVVLRDAFGG